MINIFALKILKIKLKIIIKYIKLKKRVKNHKIKSSSNALLSNIINGTNIQLSYL